MSGSAYAFAASVALSRLGAGVRLHRKTQGFPSFLRHRGGAGLTHAETGDYTRTLSLFQAIPGADSARIGLLREPLSFFIAGWEQQRRRVVELGEWYWHNSHFLHNWANRPHHTPF